ncbi:MAG: 6-phosphogluconolactonase [Thermoleophilaceae bacterium]
MSQPRVEVHENPAEAAARLLTEAAEGGAHIALSGGSTPKAAYELAAGIGADWTSATLWFGDERCVPPDHEQSNYLMAKQALLDRLERPPAIHRMPGELGPDDGAVAYEEELRGGFGNELPELDLALMGLGPDAHTASLFPGDAALEEHRRLAVGVPVPGMAPLVPRITLTLPVFNAARSVVFLVQGEDKAEAVARAFSGRRSSDAPASLVEPRSGSLVLLADEAAVSQLRQSA